MRRLLYLAGGLVLLAAIGVAALVGITLLRDDDANLATSAPAIPTSTAQTPATGVTPAPSGPLPAGISHFVVDSSQSLVKYVVTEKLSRLPVENDAVGTTKAITGDVYVGSSGLADTPKSTFRVDLRTLMSDERLRDVYVRNDTLQTNQPQNQFAVFTIDRVDGFPTSYVEGTEVAMSLTGQMTIKGVTKPVTWQVKARQAGNVLTATADADLKMTDFGITPPSIPTAKSHDEFHLQVVFVSNRAAV